MAQLLLARGANLQKYRFKRTPQRRFLRREAVAIAGGNRMLLRSGFSRIARHVNCLGKILAVGVVLALGHSGDP